MADQQKKTQKKKRPQLGKLPRLYRFFLNPYEDVRFSSCPQCANKTRQRKLQYISLKDLPREAQGREDQAGRQNRETAPQAQRAPVEAAGASWVCTCYRSA